ncbi:MULTISPECIES: hypothetical protein [Burkholderia cepacia complex]|uniref:hypothetical protein n=1 Tax=Burkholderia cepacia complex TaxID=87882 RepID=UPI002AB61CBA|nr:MULTISPECIES: hypothetical protein [Burkholderia cepacia complex]
MTQRYRTEELTLVFTVLPLEQPAKLRAGGDAVEITPIVGSVTPRDAFNILLAIMQRHGVETIFTEGPRKIATSALQKRIETKGTWGHLETANLSFRYGVVGAYDHCFVSIGEKVANAAGDWETWAMPFVALEGFVEGWVVDIEYNYWQNAKDPIEYDAAGRNFSHLPLKSNGLPPPLEQLEIDTSRNPGRWMLRQGYVEAVGAIMWLSELFWDRVGAVQKSRLKSANGIRSTESPEGVVEVRASESCFTSDETAEIQDRLRECLYG